MHVKKTRWSEVPLALIVLLACGYFYGGALWNQNSRLNPVFAFVEPGPDQGSFRMDRFLVETDTGGAPLVNTGDWASFDGHYYSNKAPGTILLGVPFYFVLYHAQRLAEFDLDSPILQITNAYLINLFVSGIFLAAAIVAFRRLLEILGTAPVHATGIALLAFFATGLFPYATQIWGHTTAAAFVILALYAQARGTRASTQWAGFAAGLAVLTEYTTVIIVLLLGVKLLTETRRRAVHFAIGGVLPILLYVFYHWTCFKTPLGFASSFSNPVMVEAGRFGGLFGAPTFEALAGITFSPYRGIFVHMPILILCLVGLAFWLWRTPRRLLPWVVAASVLAYVLLITGFNGWRGGSSVLSRYLIPVLPLLLLALKEIYKLRSARVLVSLTAGLSCFNMLIIAAVSPIASDKVMNPLYGLSYKHFFRGELHPGQMMIRLHALRPDVEQLRRFDSWNLGELLGLNGHWSLLPFGILLGLLLWWLFYAVQAEERRRGENKG